MSDYNTLEKEYLALEAELEQDAQADEADTHEDAPAAVEAEDKPSLPDSNKPNVDDQNNPKDSQADSEQKHQHEPTDVEKYAEERRKRRAYERKMHAADKRRAEVEAENVELKARLERATQQGITVPELPKTIDKQAIRGGDPDAIADALEVIERSLVRPAPLQPSTVAEPANPAQAFESFDAFLDSLPDTSEVHKIAYWTERDPVRYQMAQQVERELYDRLSQQGQSLEAIYTQVARETERRVQTLEQHHFKPAANATPRSLSQVAGQGGQAAGSLVEQFLKLPPKEQTAFYAKLSPRDRERLEMALED